MTPDQRKASWRGVPFGIWEQEGSFGRATVVHEYPFRDSVWVEDLGRATRRIGLIGFRVGDDVAELQREMIEAAEQEGPGQLVHPTLGLLKVSLVDFRCFIRRDMGRVVEFHFLFVEAGSTGIQAGTDYSAHVATFADALNGAARGDFLTAAGAALKSGAAVARQVQTTVAGWTRLVDRTLGDIRGVLNVAAMVAPGIDRRFGRFVARYRRALAPVTGTIGRVSGGLNTLVVARARVADLVGKVGALAGRL